MDSICLLRNIVDRYKAEFYKRGITICDELGQEPLKLSIDAKAMEKVFLALIDNVVYFNRPNGKVYLTLLVEKNKKGLILSDTGRGMTASALNKIMLQQDSVDRRDSNFLNASELLGKLNGHIKIESQLHVGTQVSIWWKC